MSEQWLEILDDNIDTDEIDRQVQQRLAQRKSVAIVDPNAISAAVWQDVIGNIDAEEKSWLRTQDCDVVPRNYVIDWRIPILGPINATIRRLINAEIRRFLLPSLERQSFVNRQLLDSVQTLSEENKRLQAEVDQLRRAQDI